MSLLALRLIISFIRNLINIKLNAPSNLNNCPDFHDADLDIGRSYELGVDGGQEDNVVIVLNLLVHLLVDFVQASFFHQVLCCSKLGYVRQKE